MLKRKVSMKNKTAVKLGDYFYYPEGEEKPRYKINYLSRECFEFGKIYKGRIGWGLVKDLIKNPDTDSKVKWVFIPKIHILKQ